MIFVYFDQNFSISQLGYKLDNEKYTLALFIMFVYYCMFAQIVAAL